MPDSEQSFADRKGRAELLSNLIADFEPAFAPLDEDIAPAGFAAFVASLGVANATVTEKEFAFLSYAGNRRILADALKETALRVKDHVTSNSAWSAWHTSVSREADKVRGQVIPKKKDPTPPAEGDSETPAPRAPKGSRSQQGYYDLFAHFGRLIEALKQVTGYTAADASGLELEDLQAQSEAFSQILKDTSEREAPYIEAVRARSALYNDKKDGLNARIKAIKKAVRSQYSAGSEQYASVKTVKV